MENNWLRTFDAKYYICFHTSINIIILKYF